MNVGASVRGVAYGIAEIVTGRRGVRREIDGEVLRLAPRWSRYYPARYDPAKRSFLSSHCTPASLALDIGAHLGLYSVVMARAVGPAGRVIAFEPTPSTAVELRRTLHLNGLADRVDVREAAVGALEGSLTFHDTGDALSNANSLVRGARTRSSFDVQVTTVDVVADGHMVSCIKIDVEGAELDVLRGACETMRATRPAIALEVHPAVIGEEGVRSIWEIAADHDYEVLVAGHLVALDDLLGRTDGYEIELLPGSA